MTASRGTVRALLVGGPMYETLYDAVIPAFERESGYAVEVLGRLPHPALNDEAARLLPRPDGGIDLLSTHTKYAPSQAAHLIPLDDLLPNATFEALSPRIRALATFGGHMHTLPRFLDLRLLYVRREAFDAETEAACARWLRQPATAPRSWSDLVALAAALTRPGRHGFLFPGRDSGLFGTFYEILVSAGGDLFDDDLAPRFHDGAGIYAADLLTELHARRRVTPANLPDLHYDEISAVFRRGEAAMVCDWPGSDHLYRSERSCSKAASVEVHALPLGPTGRRAAYGGCHAFAIPTHARNRDGGLALLQALSSHAARLFEARQGAIPVTTAALGDIRREADADPRERRRWELLESHMNDALIIPPKFAAYPQCEDALWRAIQRIMLGEAPPPEALAQAAATIDTVVKGERR